MSSCPCHGALSLGSTSLWNPAPRFGTRGINCINKVMKFMNVTSERTGTSVDCHTLFISHFMLLFQLISSSRRKTQPQIPQRGLRFNKLTLRVNAEDSHNVLQPILERFRDFISDPPWENNTTSPWEWDDSGRRGNDSAVFIAALLCSLGVFTAYQGKTRWRECVAGVVVALQHFSPHEILMLLTFFSQFQHLPTAQSSLVSTCFSSLFVSSKVTSRAFGAVGNKVYTLRLSHLWGKSFFFLFGNL